jgi:hypothetical protein
MVTILIFFNASIGGALDLMLRYTRDEYILATHNVVSLMWMVQYDIRLSRAIRYPMMQEKKKEMNYDPSLLGHMRVPPSESFIYSTSTCLLPVGD